MFTLSASDSYLWMSGLLTLVSLGMVAKIVLADKAPPQREILVLAGLWSALWWTVAGHGNQECTAKFVAASLAAFAVGTVAGFLFSSYGDEKESVGKVREWLVGGITALTVAEVAKGSENVKGLLIIFVPKACPDDFGIIAGMTVVFFVGGFFLMFLNRELVLNVLLAKSRAMRKSIEEKGEAANQALVEALGRMAAEETWETGVQQEPLVRDPSVQEFLDLVERNIEKGEGVRLHDIKKAATLYSLSGQNAKLVKFLEQVRIQYPRDPDILAMYARACSEVGNRRKAIEALQQFKQKVRGPHQLDKVLGFHLLWSEDVPGLKASVEHTSSYLTLFPNDDGALFNLACAYAQLYEKTGEEQYEKLALEKLEAAITANPVWKQRARELTAPGEGDFASLRDKETFKKLVENSGQADASGVTLH